MAEEKRKQTVQTTGHAWDGDLQEFNNPLPNWWLWGFYATVVFSVIYWFLFPAWPVGAGYTKGMGNNIEYTTRDGKTVTTHWNTRALLEKEMQEAREAQADYLQMIRDASYEDILNDPNKRGFAMSLAKVLFADNCATCHQAGGAGLVGRYPNLADDAWLWGGDYAHIEETIRSGRNGNMPAFGKQLSKQQLADVGEYVLSLSGQAEDPVQVKRGEAIFNGAGGCMACHTSAGTGNIALGAANLTDQVWTVARINAGMTHEQKQQAIVDVVSKGISRKMPAWGQRFTDTELKMLAFYVHEFGGGK
mgnify:CR=1 FL=1